MTGEKGHLAFIDMQIDITQGFLTAGVALADIMKMNHSLFDIIPGL